MQTDIPTNSHPASDGTMETIHGLQGADARQLTRQRDEWADMAAPPKHRPSGRPSGRWFFATAFWLVSIVSAVTLSALAVALFL